MNVYYPNVQTIKTENRMNEKLRNNYDGVFVIESVPFKSL